MIDQGAPLVAHVLYRLDFGGLENGVVNLINRMPRERYRHAIVCLAGFGEEFRRRLQRDDVAVVSLDKRPGKDIAMYGRAWQLLRRLRPAIIHTRNLGAVDLQWVAWAAGVRRRVHGEHGWEAADPEGRNPRSVRIRRACRPVIQRYVPMSQDLAKWLQDCIGVAPGRIRQLYNGVDTRRFSPGNGPDDTRAGTITVGTVGRLDPVKNQARLLRAVAELRRREPQSAHRLRLLIVGDGPLRASLEALAAQLEMQEIVEFAGARIDTPDLLRRMDVFVLPSINEGISNTVLEAMATGLPVVAARVGGNPELVQDGVTGCLYDPAPDGALEQALLPYLLDGSLRRRHGLAGRERALREFGLDAMVQRYLELYDEMMIPG
jgi:sugar transferase (PEP-CTERM/EpsH1 system associated)